MDDDKINNMSNVNEWVGGANIKYRIDSFFTHRK